MPACRRRCRRRFMLALEISRPPSSWPAPCCSSSDAALQSTLPEICTSPVVTGLLKNADCAVPPVDRQPAIRFLRLQEKNNNQSLHGSDRPQFYPILDEGFDGPAHEAQACHCFIRTPFRSRC